MKKDISFYPVEDVALAVARKKNNLGADEWHVYIINNKSIKLSNLLITSKGYGEKDGEKQLTSTLRHFIEHLEPGGFVAIEPIDPSVFHLFNEYWVSFYVGDHIFDKKFIFVPDSIKEENLILIKQLGLEGIMHL
jgi:hypothetical protein